MSDSHPKLIGLSIWLQQKVNNERNNLRLFVIGATLFFMGLGILLYAEQSLLPSLTQELIAGAGISLAALGALMAILGYLALIFLRILRLTKKDD